jgi:hypothetical protein
MAEESKGLAMVILGIVAVIAVVGMVLLFSKATSTGNFVMASEYAQFNPEELCEERVGCPLRGVNVGGMGYATQGPLMAVCACPGGDVLAPLARPFDWREEYFAE